MKPAGTQIQVQEELLLAKQSREEGNEGRARVCARRAAGAAAQLFLYRHEKIITTENAYQSLKTLKDKEELPDRIQLAVIRLIQRVNEDHQLPAEIDLIHEARLVIQFLEADNSGS
jgi:hypothetical protein